MSITTADPVISPVVPPVDVETLASMANAFFRALPGQDSGLAAGGISPPAVPAGGPAGGIAPLSAPLPVSPVAGQPVTAPPPAGGFGAPPPSLPPASPSPVFPSPVTASPAIAPAAFPAPVLPDPVRTAAPGPSPFAGSPLPPAPVQVPPGHGLPDADSLRSLLSSISTAPSRGFPAQGLPSWSVPGTIPGSSTEAAGAGSDLYFLPARPAAPAAAPPATTASFDVQAVRRDFPILGEQVNGRPLVWLDNAATTQKPRVVIERLSHFYEHENSNIHRAAHTLAARSTDAYEQARDSVRRFLNAGSVNGIVFVRGTTEAINLVAQAWGRHHLKAGDEIVITWLEHHANIVPWQLLCAETGAVLRVVPVDDHGQVRLDEYQKLLSRRPRLVSLTQVSNALGTVTPAREMVAMAHAAGSRVLVDGAQAVSHMPVDVQSLDADWYVFSGHKVFGPTGIGVLYGKPEVLEEMQPWQGGGNMIRDVTFERTEYHPAPARFEAGTGNIADAVGLGAALDYVMAIGMDAIGRYEHDLLLYGTRLLSAIPGLRLVGTAAEKAGVLSFVLDGIPPEQVGKALNAEGIAVRSGHHCAQPILRRFGLEATVRPSLAFYNTPGELDHLARVVEKIRSS